MYVFVVFKNVCIFWGSELSRSEDHYMTIKPTLQTTALLQSPSLVSSTFRTIKNIQWLIIVRTSYEHHRTAF